MSRVRQLLNRLKRARPGAGASDHALEHEFKKTRARLGSSVVFALEVRDSEIKVIEHSALVSTVAVRIAERLDLSEADTYTLQTAAQLHEVGMFAIPQELLRRPTPLTRAELEQVRAHATISAEVAVLSQPPRVAQLIERQYEDYRSRSASMEERDDLLAGILRVADVIAAVTSPRPYQDPMPVAARNELLEVGAGSRFHPVAVQSALELSGL